jgi:SAM-dependent methyltransferase
VTNHFLFADDSPRNFRLQMLPCRCHFLTSFDAITRIAAINHFSDRPRVIAEWARLLKVGGRLLFTDPITLTGPPTNADDAVRSSAGVYLFVPYGYDECVIAQCGLRLLLCEDVTANMAKVAEARCVARASKSGPS